MTYSAALTQLEALNVTGITAARNYGAVDLPVEETELPALITETVSQPFIEGLAAWNIPTTTTQLTVFVDHVLLVEGKAMGTPTTRWANLVLYLDRYTDAISADMLLGGNLIVPLQIIVLAQGEVGFRLRGYSGIRFRHRWELKVT